jgi:hypothetical protein
MYSRTLGLVAAASFVLIACGGDDGDTGPQCMGTEMSTPGQANDPCPQDNAACLAVNGKAYAKCGPDMRWAKTCDCIPVGSTPGTVTMTMPQVAAPICGDGKITGTEKCEAGNLNGQTCAALGYNGGGMLICNATTCTFDTLMCRMTTTTSSGAGTSGGAGMGGGGTGS